MLSAISLTPSLSKDELFRLWKNRHSEYLKHTKKITQRNKLRYKRDEDRKIRIQSFYNVNDQVLVHNDHKQHKLSPEFLGPCTVIENKRSNYFLRIGKTKTSLVHGNRL